MIKMASPYTTDILAILIVVAAIFAHVAGAIVGRPVTDTAFIDNAALLVIGVTFGVRTGANGAGTKADAAAQAAADAHARLDALGAPPAQAGGPA